MLDVFLFLLAGVRCVIIDISVMRLYFYMYV